MSTSGAAVGAAPFLKLPTMEKTMTTAVLAKNDAGGGDGDRFGDIRRQVGHLVQTNQMMTLVITPEMAQVMLERNTRNRPLMKAAVRRLVGEIENGRLQLSGEPIIFNSDGLLNDGQHRLKAIAESGLPVRSDVRFGVSPDAFIVTGRGIPHGAVLSSAARWLILYRRNAMGATKGSQGSRYIAPGGVPNIVREEPGLVVAVEWALTEHVQLKRALLPAGVLAFLRHLFVSIDPERAEKFFDEFVVGGDPENPMGYARNLCISKLYDRANSGLYIGAVIKAWNHYRRGTQLKLLRMTASEAFPVAE